MTHLPAIRSRWPGPPTNGPARRGLTIVDVIMTLAGVAVLAVLFAAVVKEADGRFADVAPEKADGQNLMKIAHAMAVLGREFSPDSGSLPTAGLIDRLSVEINGQSMEIPGRGREDVSQNTTANLYSALIMQNYLAPATCVSPTERNPKVTVDDDYDWNLYDPSADVYWDPAFTGDLASGSNVSYAHLLPFGERKNRWRFGDETTPLLGVRGPRNGVLDKASYTCDPTSGAWTGLLIYGDGRIHEPTAPTPTGLTWTDAGGTVHPDNLFAFDDGENGKDIVITFTTGVVDGKPVTQFD